MYPPRTAQGFARRLRAATGRLDDITEMLEQGSACCSIVQELKLVEEVIQRIKKAFIEDHLVHRVEGLLSPVAQRDSELLVELKEVVRHL